MEEIDQNQSWPDNYALRKKLDAVSWGLFFIWMGIAFLADVGWGAGFLGVGFIILGTQVTRRYFGMKLEGLWIIMGLFFVLGGVGELFNPSFDPFQYCVWN